MEKLLFTISFLFISIVVFAQEIQVKEIGRYTDGRKDALEIAAYDSATARLFITNGATDSIDIVDITNPKQPKLVGHIDVLSYGGGVNSVVATGNGYVVAAIEARNKQLPGQAVFYDTDGNYVISVSVGALPDMITITPDKAKIVVANEGEPNDAYTIDPEGSISIIDISNGIPNLNQRNVYPVPFANAPDTLIGIKGSIRKPNTTYQQDLEPEYITIDKNSTVAAVTCQESNVIAFVDLKNYTVRYAGLGFKNNAYAGNGFDPSDKDSIHIRELPIKSAFQPDAIASYSFNDRTFFVTANEGEGRDYKGYSSETRVKKLKLDASLLALYPNIQDDNELGRLKTFTPDVLGDIDGDGDGDELYTYGTRSFSIWNDLGQLVYDSGDDFEQYMAKHFPTFFNTENGKSSKFDGRSDNGGPEPEGITVGQVGTETYAFIALERQNGIMVYNITNPYQTYFVDYIHSIDLQKNTITDISPEGMIFIPASKNHIGKNLLIVSHEVSGTTTIFEVSKKE